MTKEVFEPIRDGLLEALSEPQRLGQEFDASMEAKLSDKAFRLQPNDGSLGPLCVELSDAQAVEAERDNLKQEVERLRAAAQNRERSEEKMRVERDALKHALQHMASIPLSQRKDSAKPYWKAQAEYFQGYAQDALRTTTGRIG